MNREIHVPLRESLGVKFPRATRPFSVADDRSGVSYTEYRCVYGEDAESALRFLFRAMAPKPDPRFPFQGIPKSIYMDSGYSCPTPRKGKIRFLPSAESTLFALSIRTE